MKILFALAICACCTAAAAQGMYKCKNAAGKITYAGNECHLLGLLPAGEVKGQASVAPATKVPEQRAAEPSSPPPADKPAASGPEAKADKPERRCFTVKLARGGTTTRCNDNPE